MNAEIETPILTAPAAPGTASASEAVAPQTTGLAPETDASALLAPPVSALATAAESEPNDGLVQRSPEEIRRANWLILLAMVVFALLLAYTCFLWMWGVMKTREAARSAPLNAPVYSDPSAPSSSPSMPPP